MSRTKLAAYTLGALAVGVVAGLIVSYVRGGASPGDDQPPIIVRDGSVIFEGGDSQNPKKGQDTWVQIGSNQHWKAIKNNGNSVASFTAYIAGVVDPNGCPQTTMPGDAIEVDYTDPSAQPTTLSFHVLHTDDGNGHHSPQVNADDKSGLTAGATSTASAPPQLLAGAVGQGYVSKVIATDPSGAPTATCNLPQPLDANRSLVRVTIVPERQ